MGTIRSRRFALAFVLAALMPATALATHSNGSGPSADFFVGTLKGSIPLAGADADAKVHINARSDSSSGPGVPAQGHFDIDAFGTAFGDLHFSGSVVCLQVEGNRADARVVVERSNSPVALPGFPLRIHGLDQGEPGTKESDPPVDGVAFDVAAFTTDCPVLPFPPTSDFTQGNIVIHDGV